MGNINPMCLKIEDRILLILKESLTDSDRDSITEQGKNLIGKFINSDNKKRGYWEWLGNQTNIPAKNWRNLYGGYQKPTPAMIEAISRLKPQYAFWLATGITDITNGHIAPITVATFPEYSHIGDVHSESYFRKSLEALDKFSAQANLDFTDQQARIKYFERVKYFANWVGGVAITSIYKFIDSETYKELETVWKERESSRNKRISLMTGKSQKNIEKISGLQMDEVIGNDNRVSHQSPCDIFYLPKIKDS